MGQERRLEFQEKLKETLDSPHVYFQPPPNATLQYPCIVYERDNASFKSADNKVYSWQQRYQVTYIDRLPDSDVIEKLAHYPLSSFSRHFAKDNLNHDVFVIYY